MSRRSCDTQSVTVLNKDRITISDILRIEKMCHENVQADDLYAIRNDAKLRAVGSTTNYEEFKEIIDAAHLKPIDKKDKQNSNTKTRLWNLSARK